MDKIKAKNRLGRGASKIQRSITISLMVRSLYYGAFLLLIYAPINVRLPVRNILLQNACFQTDSMED